MIGTQGLSATDSAIVREIGTGSWVGMRHQRDGVGAEMRAAVLAFAFDHLGAHTARSFAFTDNVASRGVSRRLGYRPDGSMRGIRRGVLAEQVRLLLTPDTFVRPPWTLRVEGLDTDCRAQLGG